MAEAREFNGERRGAAHQDLDDLLLTGGHVIDPANEIDGVRDVAIRNGRIARVAASISAQSAKRTVNVKGLYVVPGWWTFTATSTGTAALSFPTMSRCRQAPPL